MCLVFDRNCTFACHLRKFQASKRQAHSFISTRIHTPVHLGQEPVRSIQSGRLVQVPAVQGPDAVQCVAACPGRVPRCDATPVRSSQIQHSAQRPVYKLHQLLQHTLVLLVFLVLLSDP